MPILILKKKINFATQNNYLHLINMKKHLPLFLLIFVFAGFVSAQRPTSSSDVISPAATATFAEGYVWSVNNDNGNNICRSGFDAANNLIGAPEVMAPEQESFRTPDSLPDFKDWLILPNK